MIKLLLFLAIFSIPFSLDYTLIEPSRDPFSGWAAAFLVTLSDLIFLTLLVVWKLATRGLPCRRGRVVFWRPAAFFILACLISIPGSIWKLYGCVAVLQLCKIVLIYYGISRAIFRHRAYISVACWALISSLLFQSCVAALQFVTQDYYNFMRTGAPAALTQFGSLIRSHGTIGVPNALAAFVIPLLLLVICRLVFDEGGNRTLYGLIFCAGVAALLFTFSRSGWVTFAICAFFLFLKVGRERRRSPYIYALLGVGLVVILESGIIGARISSSDEGSMMDRWYLMQIAAEMIRGNLLTGVGINNYWFAMHHYIPPDYDWSFIYVVHNVFLLVFAETGITGFAAILALFTVPAVTIYRAAGRSSGENRMLALWIATSIVATALLNLVEYTWASSILCSSFFLLLGMGDALVNAAERAQQ